MFTKALVPFAILLHHAAIIRVRLAAGPLWLFLADRCRPHRGHRIMYQDDARRIIAQQVFSQIHPLVSTNEQPDVTDAADSNEKNIVLLKACGVIQCGVDPTAP